MKKLILVFLMVFGMASMASAESKTITEEFVEEFESFITKYPKTYKACMNYEVDSKNYFQGICDRLFEPFSLHKKNGKRAECVTSAYPNWREMVEDCGGEEKVKKILLEYGMSFLHGVSGIGIAESYARTYERR